MIFMCFRCGKLFSWSETRKCSNCNWYICPFCEACLCSLNKREKFVAIAVWLSNTVIDSKEWWKWYNYLLKLKEGREGRD